MRTHISHTHIGVLFSTALSETSIHFVRKHILYRGIQSLYIHAYIFYFIDNKGGKRGRIFYGRGNCVDRNYGGGLLKLHTSEEITFWRPHALVVCSAAKHNAMNVSLVQKYEWRNAELDIGLLLTEFNLGGTFSTVQALEISQLRRPTPNQYCMACGQR